jgi:hypothetical protein
MIRRFVFSLFWCGMFWLGLATIGAGVYSGQKAAPFTDDASPTIPARSAAEFRARYGWPTLGVAAALAGVAAWRGWLPGTRKN